MNVKSGDVVVSRTGIGGPAFRVLAIMGDSAKLESLARNEKDPSQPAARCEFLLKYLVAIPEDHYATRSPFYDFTVR